ncbi:MAG TPA: 2-amino-4-hydroxy-6-hydroxymethyldihydropteridine diphosphokinase, partial [Candidatus Ozemobacteraceae bacterium]|nr:2-amino-4-hydroxy-6-hydroxymethyldihydropteridine diphosphokinase [Candidatus Ozemobacteraceae bacterium]
MHTIFLGLGSNLGHREENLQHALDLLQAHVTDLRVSSLYETAPVGLVDQPAFLNAVCTGTTNLTAPDLLLAMLGIEASLGRVRTLRWGPRIIDIDLLLYDALILQTPELTIPHPRMAERAFVLVPLAELAPDLVHPVLRLPLKSILASLSPTERDVRMTAGNLACPDAYESAIRYLDTLFNFETQRRPDAATAGFTLERMHSLLELLGRPERRFPVIHIAGTKGKGSTTAMIASILTASGRKTGWYTSPHFYSLRERIRIDRTMISRQEFAGMTDELQQAISRLPGPPPSHFEALTAMAFAFFARSGVDVAVIEAGMGGTHDATNVVVPLVSVITSISLDHTAVLGNTLAEIAGQKAGIVKEHGFLVSAPQNPEVIEVFRRVCEERSAGMRLTRVHGTIGNVAADLTGQSFSCKALSDNAADSEPEPFRISLLGDHQLENAAVAGGHALGQGDHVLGLVYRD